MAILCKGNRHQLASRLDNLVTVVAGNCSTEVAAKTGFTVTENSFLKVYAIMGYTGFSKTFLLL